MQIFKKKCVMENKEEELFIEIAHYQEFKHNKPICGDCFLSKKINEENRYVAVLSDGLGSGVKANVLSTMTASMALNFRLRREPILKSAINIMNVLPIDSVRNVSYATFTIVDTDFRGNTQVIEFDSPDFLLFRDDEAVEPVKESIGIDKEGQKFTSYDGDLDQRLSEGNEANKFRVLKSTHLKLCKGDRIVFYSDGVTQSGMGTKNHPFGWGDDAIKKYVLSQISNNLNISARDLSHKIVLEALRKDSLKSKDDITCAVIYAREPRKLIICTGPPYDAKNDTILAQTVDKYSGKKVICGGTTSKIISRELNRDVKVDLKNIRSTKYPPMAQIEGIDLVTEGILTLGTLSNLLEREDSSYSFVEDSPAEAMFKLILESDIIDICVGTRINEAHQDPSLPVELEIRRNVVKKIADILEEKWLKKVRLRYL